jgi:L-lysine exporter family protein LysE/ArgO
LNIFISYILLGLSLAAPIGPVNAAQLDKGIKQGFWPAWLIGLGAMAADAVFMLIIYFGSAHILSSPFIKTFLYLFGSFILLYSGIESLNNTSHIRTPSFRSKEETALKSFTSGFFMTLSNPLSILFWLGIYGSILAKTAESSGAWDLLIYSSGIFIGLMLWDVTMASVASLSSKLLNDTLLMWISRLAGLSLISFGLYFGYQAIVILFL